ncbi:MAG: PAS domain-containing protein, partial [Gammaproteobacteria bacterium]|nr:PAS domain-containing protein [Gammaproteobacteria bacterium]
MAGQQKLARLLDGDSSLARELAQLLNQHSIISITDIAGRITFVNDKFCEISGYTETELLGQNHRILKSENHPDTFYNDMWDSISHGNTWNGLICNQRKDHSNYWVESTIMPILDNKGKPDGYLSARTDVTAFIINDDRLTRSQQFANIGTWDWNIQTGELIWSDRIAPLFGYMNEIPETTYENFIAAVHPEDQQMVEEAITNCVKQEAEYNIEHRVVWQDDSIHWLHEKGNVVRSKDGTPLHMLGIVRDITSYKTAQLALQESEQRLTEAQKIAGIGNWSWEVTSGNIYWSDEIYRIFGYQPDEFEPTYEKFIAHVHPDDLEQIKQSEHNAFAKGEKHSIDHRIIMPNGDIRWVHEEAEARFNIKGKPIYLQGTVQDITQRKYTEQLQKGRSQIQEEVLLDKPLENILETIILHAEDMQPGMMGSVLLLDDSGQYLMHASAPHLPDFYNAAVNGLKIGPDVGSCGTAAFTGKRVIVENIHTHPHWETPRELAKKAGLGACWSQPIISSSGEILGTFAMYYPVPRLPDKSHLNLATELAQFATIAIEQTRARHKLIATKNEAEKANKAKSQFLSSMSHELRTPLNAIIGFSQLLEMEADKLNPNQKGHIHEIHHAGLHLLDLINEVLDLARIEAGNMALSIEAVYLDDIINECLIMTMPMAVEHGIKLSLILE